MHIGRGIYFGSYHSPRILVWSIGVIILILMMAKLLWPTCFIIYKKLFTFTEIIKIDTLLIQSILPLLPFNKKRTKAILRIGPHNLDILSIIICGMLGDWWSHLISGKNGPSVRFQLEQSVSNSTYIHNLAIHLHKLGYSASFVPKLVKKSEVKLNKENIDNRFNYRLTLFTFTSFIWIHNGFYKNVNGFNIKIVPNWISEYITPLGLAHWIMKDGSRQKGQGVMIATNSFTYKECLFLANILNKNFGLKTSVIKTDFVNQWRISIWKESMPILIELIIPYFVPEMMYKLYN